MSRRLLLIFLALLFQGATPLLAAFGLGTATDFYTVDTGAGLVFKVRRTDNGSSTQSAGDLASLVYNGVEYQNTSKGSQINSGFDYLYNGVSAVNVSAAVVNTNFIKITVTAGDLTHYYMARNGYPHIYMATHFLTEPDTLGLCRFIVRVPAALLSNGPAPSDIRNNTSAIESADIFGMADGTTRSKHYSNMRLKDWSYIGATGSGVGMWMARSNHEGDSGGPFYRSLLNQCGTDQEITYIINYGEGQTEPFRPNILNGAYTLIFTNGSAPPAVDTSWVAMMGLTGFVGAAGRGSVSGAGITERDTSQAYTVGFANTTAQYWTDAAAGNGAFTMGGMLPGTYAMSVYKNEFAVYSTSVTVNAGATISLGSFAITADPSRTVPMWRIGNWDGSPAEFLNGDKVTTMHPADVRMSAWNPGPYVVATSTPALGMPCYQWKDVNGGQVVQFNLTAAQQLASTVRIGITTAYEGARPKINVNAWASSNPSPSSQPNSRTLTVGTYRGNNTMFTFAVPASAFVAGVNTLTIYPISGSGTTGFLSAGFSLDCIDFYQGTAQTVSVPNGPANLIATAGSGQVGLTWAASPNTTSYSVGRATTTGGPYTEIATGVTSTTFSDTALPNGTTFYYVVSAANTSGAGLPSAETSATPSGPISRAQLRFDETAGTFAADTFANGFNGSLVNGPTWAAGRINNAVSLDGIDDHVTLPAGIVAGLSDFTISTWVNLNSLSSWSRVFDFGTGQTNYVFLTPRNSITSTVRFAITGSGGEQVIDGAAALPIGVWTHVAVTLSGTTGTLYVNGAVVGTNTSMTVAPFALGSTMQNYIGKSQFGGDPYLNGVVDDFQVHGRALTASEIAAIVTAPPGAIYKLEGNAADSSGVANHGTASNVTYTGGLVGAQAGLFNGTTSYITIPRSVGTDFTVSMWAKTTANGGTGAQWWSGRGLVDGEVAGNAADWGTAVLNGKLAFGVGGADTTLSSSAAINDGNWHHLAATRDNASGAMRVYVDGVLSGSGSGPTGARTAPPALRIGSIQTGGANGFFSGSIDGVYLYNRVLNLAEIAALASGPTALSAAAGNASVLLTWTSVSPNPTTFNIKRALTSGGPFTNIATATTTSYADANVANGTPYFYVVSAANNGDESANSAQASATPSSFAGWQQTWFNAAQFANTSISGPSADANGDGYKNLLAYAFNVSPWVNLTPALPTSGVQGGFLTITFTRRKAPTDVTYIVEVGGDLGTWNSGAAYTTQTSATSLDATTERITVRDNSPATGRRFIRLNIGN